LIRYSRSIENKGFTNPRISTVFRHTLLAPVFVARVAWR